MAADYTVVSHEQDGRILSGVGPEVDVETLAETLDRHTPEDKRVEPEQAAPVEEAAPATDALKQTRGQKRFSDLTREREDQKRRADSLEKELNELRARGSQQTPIARPGPSSASEAVPSSPNGGDSGTTRPEPSEDDIGTKYKTYAEFTRDQARWVNEQNQSDIDARIRHGIEADRASRSFQDQLAAVRAKGREAYADFDAIMQSGPGLHVNLAPDGDVATFQRRATAIVNHPASEHLQYVIAKDPSIPQRMSKMTDVEFGMELMRLTPTAAVASPASTAAPALATAPTPYQPVGSGSKTSTISSGDIAKTGDYDAYHARRAVEREQRRR